MPLEGRKWLPRELVGLLYDAGWKEPKNLILMTAVTLAESDGYEQAWQGPNDNGSYDWGLFQLNSIHSGVTKEMAYNPAEAVKFARKLFVAQKFGPWVAYANGNYKKHLLVSIEGLRNYWRNYYGYPLV